MILLGADTTAYAGATYGSSRWDSYSCWYFYNRMSEADQDVWDTLYGNCVKIGEDTTGTYAKTEKVKVPEGWTKSKVEQFCLYFRQSNPQFFFLRSGFGYSYNEAGTITGITIPIYADFQSGADRADAVREFLEQVEEWAIQVRTCKTEFNRAKAAHDLVISNVKYNTGSKDDGEQFTQTAYGAACKGTAYCAGYSMLYSLLCNAADVDTFAVTSATHQWNLCRVSDSWYNVDVTFNDSLVSSSYFCRSDAALDKLDSGSSHDLRDIWVGEIPACSADSGATNSSYGSVKAPSGQLNAPTIRMDASGDQMKVTITAAEGAVIYYTLDGTMPSAANSRSDLYFGAFPVETGIEVRAIAVKKGSRDSEVSSTNSTSDYSLSSGGTALSDSSRTSDISEEETTEITSCDAPVVTVTTVASSGKPKLTWKAVEGAVAYKIYRATAKDGKYTLIKTTEGTTFTNTGAKVNTVYYYKVKAIAAEAAGNSSFGTVKKVTVDLARPVVSITTASGKPKLTWKAVEGATKYKIYRATSKSGSYSLLKTVTEKACTDTSAVRGKTYYYKVQALSGVSAAASAKSTVKSVKCTK